MRSNFGYFADPFAVLLDYIADVYDIEAVLFGFLVIDYALDDVHVVHRIVEDLDLVEVVAA